MKHPTATLSGHSFALTFTNPSMFVLSVFENIIIVCPQTSFFASKREVAEKHEENTRVECEGVRRKIKLCLQLFKVATFRMDKRYGQI